MQRLEPCLWILLCARFCVPQAALRHRDTQELFTAWFPSYAVLTRGGHFFLFKQPTAHQGTTELRGSELLFEFKLCK